MTPHPSTAESDKTNLTPLRDAALRMVAKAADDVDLRFELARNFFAIVDDAVDGRSLREAQLAFMRWERVRGVLNSPDDTEAAGSRWWRRVNDELLCDQTEALLARTAPIGASRSPGARRWTAFLNEPSPRTFYAAHNYSVITGYLDAIELAAAEKNLEQLLMNHVLLRVLFVQAMVENERAIVGRVGALGRVLGIPRGTSVAVALDVVELYPRTYPLRGGRGDRAQLLAKVHVRTSRIGSALAAIVDRHLMRPKAAQLLQYAARSHGQPNIVAFVTWGRPHYPVSGDRSRTGRNAGPWPGVRVRGARRAGTQS